MWFLFVEISALIVISVITLAVLLPMFIELRKDKKQLKEQINNLYKNIKWGMNM